MSNGKNDELKEGLRIIANISNKIKGMDVANELDELCRKFFNPDKVDYKHAGSADIIESLVTIEGYVQEIVGESPSKTPVAIEAYCNEIVDETPLKKPNVIDRSFAKIDNND